MVHTRPLQLLPKCRRIQQARYTPRALQIYPASSSRLQLSQSLLEHILSCPPSPHQSCDSYGHSSTQQPSLHLRHPYNHAQWLHILVCSHKAGYVCCYVSRSFRTHPGWNRYRAFRCPPHDKPLPLLCPAHAEPILGRRGRGRISRGMGAIPQRGGDTYRVGKDHFHHK